MKTAFGCLLLMIFWAKPAIAQISSVPVKQDPLKDSADKYIKLFQYARALPFAEQLAAKLKMERKEETAEYGSVLNSWGNALNRTGKREEAEHLLLQGLEIRKKVLGENHPEVAQSLHNLGLLYDFKVNYPKAEAYYLQALEIRRNTLGENHPDVAQTLNNLGNLNRTMGNLTKAEAYHLQALAIRKIVFGETHQDVAHSANNLGIVYKEMGQYPKAEPLYLQALGIRKKVLGENHRDVAVSLNNLGVLYKEMGQYPKAAVYYQQALEIWGKVLGEDHPDVANALNNLGNLYISMGDYPKAEISNRQALEIRKKALGENHPDVAISLNNLGTLYHETGRYARAESYFLLALESNKISLGENHPDVATALSNIGYLNWICGNYPKGELLQQKAFGLRKKALGQNHPDVAASQINLAKLYWSMGNYPKAENHFLDWNANKQAQIQRYFPFLSDHEKEAFYDLRLSGDQEGFKSFCVRRYTGNKAISGYLYNDQLATKGLMLSSSSKWRHRIRTSGDSSVARLFKKWEFMRNSLNKLLQSTDSSERAGVDSIMAQSEKLEKELSLRSEAFARLSDKKMVDWKQVQKRLQPGEAAVEMVRVKTFGVSKTVTDTSNPAKPKYKIRGLTDSIQYAALIVTPTSVYPEMILLKNGNDLEGKYLKYYQNAIKGRSTDLKSYGQFWEKLGEKLVPYRRIFFSPDGVYLQINLNTLQNPKTKKPLLDEKEIHLITSTKDLLPTGEKDNQTKLAYLFGFPNFEAPFEQVKEVVATRDQKRGPQLDYFLKLNPTSISLTNLPGTQVEVERISDLLSQNGWEVHALMRDKALEETLKESDRPKLLHIATHGYFQSDSTAGSNPLLRSGLFLSRSAQTLKGTSNNISEDGILTAYEAMNLNLDNTDLVVLSACETGLGEIKNGEGVYGLQRAFKVAGAKSIIMSLWKVDDEATQELMVSFYKNWLGPQIRLGGGLKGKNTNAPAAVSSPPFGTSENESLKLANGVQGGRKRSAFLKAQKELKAKYPNPYYWGAFVMVGE